MHIDRRIFYITAITLTVLTFTLTIIMVFSTYRNMNMEQEQMMKLLTREGVVLLNLFETTIPKSKDNLTSNAPRIQQLVTSAPNDDIVYIYILDQNGTVLAHSDKKWIGQQMSAPLPKYGETIELMPPGDSKQVLEVRRYFPPIAPNVLNGHYLGVGLKIKTFRQIYHEDRRHRMMMTAILLLLGVASLFFALVVQNYYLVQRTLERMKSYIHYVVQSMSRGLISLDVKGKVTTINPVAIELTGVSKTETQDLTYDSLFPEYVDEIRGVLQNDSVIIDKEINYLRSDGFRIPMILSATQLKDNNGNKLGAVILLHDLREIKELQERARLSEHFASIGRMAATVAHEIRNPLSSIRGFAHYFTTIFDDGSEEKTYALTMIDESNRLNKIVSELLNYARPLELDIKNIPVKTLFDDTMRMIALEIKPKGIEIIQKIEPDIPLIRIDRDRMLQVLLNLVQNSISAMPNGGELTLRANWLSEQHSVQIIVQDTGSGISEQDLQRLFEPFFTTKTHGTGLGLAIARKIVNAHEGKIILQNGETKGAIATITLPQPTEMPSIVREADKAESYINPSA